MVSLKTDRLIIRNFIPEDWRELQELAIRYQASEWAQYDHPWPTSEKEVKWMAEWLASGDGYVAVCLKTTGKLIGLLNMHHRKELEGRVHGLGYVFHSYRRQLSEFVPVIPGGLSPGEQHDMRVSQKELDSFFRTFYQCAYDHPETFGLPLTKDVYVEEGDGKEKKQDVAKQNMNTRFNYTTCWPRWGTCPS